MEILTPMPDEMIPFVDKALRSQTGDRLQKAIAIFEQYRQKLWRSNGKEYFKLGWQPETVMPDRVFKVIVD